LRTSLGQPGTVGLESIHNQVFGLAADAEAMRIAGSMFGSMHQVPEEAVSSFVFPSGVGMWAVPTESGIGMSGAGLLGVTGMSGAGLLGVTGMSGAGLLGVTGMSGAGLYGMGMSGVGMSGIGMSGIGMFSASAAPLRSRKFWLLADAELIVYGATEPDATVTIGGVPIKLNPDGTFSFRLSFQDGMLDYPIMAVAADGEQMRQIRMKFTRETPLRNTNAKEEAQEESF
ncbi:MAG: hypothetical protein VKJ24_11610, partial [Synechococcales bacterium]|nr:hypothetical protein [Synechococcales bacterium]